MPEQICKNCGKKVINDKEFIIKNCFRTIGKHYIVEKQNWDKEDSALTKALLKKAQDYDDLAK